MNKLSRPLLALVLLLTFPPAALLVLFSDRDKAARRLWQATGLAWLLALLPFVLVWLDTMGLPVNWLPGLKGGESGALFVTAMLALPLLAVTLTLVALIASALGKSGPQPQAG